MKTGNLQRNQGVMNVTININFTTIQRSGAAVYMLNGYLGVKKPGFRSKPAGLSE
jgi:hypothetical protein